jgi:hypothetical protein
MVVSHASTYRDRVIADCHTAVMLLFGGAATWFPLLALAAHSNCNRMQGGTHTPSERHAVVAPHPPRLCSTPCIEGVGQSCNLVFDIEPTKGRHPVHQPGADPGHLPAVLTLAIYLAVIIRVQPQGSRPVISGVARWAIDTWFFQHDPQHQRPTVLGLLQHGNERDLMHASATVVLASPYTSAVRETNLPANRPQVASVRRQRPLLVKSRRHDARRQRLRQLVPYGDARPGEPLCTARTIECGSVRNYTTLACFVLPCCQRATVLVRLRVSLRKVSASLRVTFVITGLTRAPACSAIRAMKRQIRRSRMWKTQLQDAAKGATRLSEQQKLTLRAQGVLQALGAAIRQGSAAFHSRRRRLVAHGSQRAKDLHRI